MINTHGYPEGGGAQWGVSAKRSCPLVRSGGECRYPAEERETSAEELLVYGDQFIMKRYRARVGLEKSRYVRGISDYGSPRTDSDPNR